MLDVSFIPILLILLCLQAFQSFKKNIMAILYDNKLDKYIFIGPTSAIKFLLKILYHIVRTGAD